MNQPRESIFYSNEEKFLIDVNKNIEKTLQSIDGTLKRIEKILIDRYDEEDVDVVEKAFLIAAQEIKQQLPKD